MFEGIGHLITTLFEGLDLRRRWLAILGFGVLVVFSLLLFEQMTGTIYYNSLERKVALLAELNTLEKEGDISSKPELKRAYDVTVQELDLRPIQPFRFPTTVFVYSVTFWKVISGAALGLLFAIVSIFGGKENMNTTIGATIVAILGGFMGGLLPVIYEPWVNYLGFPIVEIVFIFLLGRRTGVRVQP